LLDCEDLVEATLNAIGSQKDIFYEEPNLSQGVEGVECVIHHGATSDKESD
jgi:hypothetical protein